jgi:predicted 2-oxoglutarate/Fe(II)-dependent dioxygenase YbiX
MVSLKDFVVVQENIIPHSLCDDILSEYADSNEWKETETEGYHSNQEVRSCYGISMSTSDVISKNEIIRKKLDSEIFECTKDAIKKYKDLFPNCQVAQDTGYDLLRYAEGQFIVSHTDCSLLNPREVSCSFALNDEFEGGEFAFFSQKLKYRIPKGAAIMFPSNFMYPHEVMKVTSGTRYSIVTWFK